MAIRYQILRPIAFVSIKGSGLSFYKVYGPLLVSVIAACAYLFLPVKIQLVGDNSASHYMASFFAILPGFYIAALAAIVAFQGGDLDQIMPDVKVTMTVNGDTALVEVSFRVFLCYLFSYLTVLSFFGFFWCVGGSLLAPSIASWIAEASSSADQNTIKMALEIAFISVLSFTSASVVFCTAQGLYFLAERVHQKLI